MTGVLQGCLLVMGITFELRSRKKGAGPEGRGHGDGDDDGHAGEATGIAHRHVSREEDHERTRLLENEH